MFAIPIQMRGSRKYLKFHPELYCTLSYSANCNGRTHNASTEACYLSGLGVSTVSSICQEICEVLMDHLWNKTVSTHMPQNEEKFKQKILDMEEFWQFPCC